MNDNKWSNYKNKEYLSQEILDENKSYYSTLFTKFNIETLNKTAIEIGAGHGMFTEIFINFFKRYSVIEPNNELFNELTTLINNKYNTEKTRLIKTTCEDLQIKKQLSFVIFTHSFQFTNFEKCKKNIDKILKNNGYLLILLPFIPFQLNNDFDKNQKWRNQILNTINFLITMDGYNLLYLSLKKYYILLFQKI